MASTSPPLADWVSNYKASSATGAPKWLKKTQSVSDWLSKATSDSAKSNYSSGVAAAIAAGKREKKISEVGEAGWHSSITTSAQSAYSTALTSKAPKFERGAAKVKPVVDSLLGSLPARGPNYAANKARVDHMAQGLEDAFKGG